MNEWKQVIWVMTIFCFFYIILVSTSVITESQLCYRMAQLQSEHVSIRFKLKKNINKRTSLPFSLPTTYTHSPIFIQKDIFLEYLEAIAILCKETGTFLSKTSHFQCFIISVGEKKKRASISSFFVNNTSFHNYLAHLTKKTCPQIKSEKVFLKVKAIKLGALSKHTGNKTKNSCSINVKPCATD